MARNSSLIDRAGIENLFGEPDLDEVVFEEEEPANIDGEFTVCCKFCGRHVPESTSHFHNGEFVGDECCWDDRLKCTE